MPIWFNLTLLLVKLSGIDWLFLFGLKFSLVFENLLIRMECWYFSSGNEGSWGRNVEAGRVWRRWEPSAGLGKSGKDEYEKIVTRSNIWLSLVDIPVPF